jgi:leader peptidase (prepilin peptidase)/N-methyltransferase
LEPLAVAFGVCGAAWGVACDRIGARWPAHEDSSVRGVDWRTLVVAIFGAAALAAVPIRFDDGVERALFGAAFAAMVLLMATDLDQRLMPDAPNLLLMALGAAALVWGGNSLVNRQPVWLPIAAAVVVPLLLYLLALPFGEGALGGGDLEFLAGVGLLVGAVRLVVAVFVGVIASGVAIAVLLLLRRITLKSYIPLAPFLIIGAVWAALLPVSS